MIRSSKNAVFYKKLKDYQPQKRSNMSMEESAIPTPEHEPLPTLDEILAEMETAGLKPVPKEIILDQINRRMPDFIMTRDFVCGLRASKKSGGNNEYMLWTTNGLEDSGHPVSKQFRFRKFTVDTM